MNKSDSAPTNKSHFTWMDKSAVRCHGGSSCRWLLARLLMSRWSFKIAANETKTHTSKIPIFVKVKDFPTGWAFWRFPKSEGLWKFGWFFCQFLKVRSTNQTPKISNGFEACQLWPGLAAVFWVTTGGAPHPTTLLSKIHPLQVLPNRPAPSSDLQVVLKCSSGTVLPK